MQTPTAVRVPAPRTPEELSERASRIHVASGPYLASFEDKNAKIAKAAKHMINMSLRACALCVRRGDDVTSRRSAIGSGYSYLSATSGSTREARRAGR